jgi:heterodisulfide reductase subunit A-like polyferredoxin
MLGESIFQAQAAAGRALTTMSQEQLTASAVVAQVQPEMCKQCLACVRSCPYNVPKMTHIRYVQIEPAECQGCGVCVAECPAKAIQLRRFTDEQIMAQAHAVMNET